MSNDGTINERLAKVELAVSKLKDGVRNMDNSMSEGGYIEEGFNIVIKEVNDVRNELRSEIRQLDKKLDIILQHLTGTGSDDK